MNLKDYLPKDVVQVGDKYFVDFKGDMDSCYSGTFLGEDYEGKFVPSLTFLESISGEFGELILNKRNSWLFTCNRIITDAVKDSGDKYLIVRNGQNDVLGLAKRVDNKFMPVFDIGHLLRREIE